MWDAIVNGMMNILIWIYRLVGGNFGVAIILFTILIRLVMYPIQAKQIKSSQAMQELQQNKKWKDTQEKYKGDKEKLAQEQMKLYQELGINPLASCLPMLLQLPIMFALYQSITRAMASTPGQLVYLARGVYSIFGADNLVPLNSKFLWMNLGQPERVYAFGLAIPVLTILVVITTFIQSKVTMPPASNAAPGDQSAAMGQMMAYYMPLMMGWITYGLASGLAVYFILSNVLGVAQQAMMGKVYWDNLKPKKQVRK